MATRRLPAEQRRKQILKSATHVFARHGYHGATTRMISDEAAVAEALIFRYFGNKKNLFCEAVKQSSTRMVDGVAHVLDTHPGAPDEALRSLLGYYLQLLNRHPDLAKMIFLVSTELDDPEVRDAYMPQNERALQVLTTHVQSWQAKGVFRTDVSPRAVAWMVFGAYQVLALMKHTGKLDEVNVDLAVALLGPYLSVGLAT